MHLHSSGHRFFIAPMSAVFNPPQMRFVFDPQGNPQKPWVLDGEHTFCDGHRMMRIEDGERVDLASVPLLLLWLFPPNGVHQRAAAHHDAAYRKQDMSRFSADAGFREIMAYDGVPMWRRLLLYWGVRLFGGLAWKGNQK